MPRSIWKTIQQQAQAQIDAEPLLTDLFRKRILAHDSISSALIDLLSYQLKNKTLEPAALLTLMQQPFETFDFEKTFAVDLMAIEAQDNSYQNKALAFLFNKGFHALQTHRIAHYLWQHEKKSAALLLQSRSSAVFNVDIHPAAQLGQGIMLDQATGIVIGETARVDNNVFIMGSVTLGGTGKDHHDRHPKIGNGVSISYGAKILGNIHVGDGAKIAACSVVLKDVDPHVTMAGVPARQMDHIVEPAPASSIEHTMDCQSINISLKQF